MGNTRTAKDSELRILNGIFGALAGVPALLGYAVLLVRRIVPSDANIDSLTAVGIALVVLGIVFAACMCGFNGYQPLQIYHRTARIWIANGLVLFSVWASYAVYLALFALTLPLGIAVFVSLFYFASGFYLCAVAFSSFHTQSPEK